MLFYKTLDNLEEKEVEDYEEHNIEIQSPPHNEEIPPAQDLYEEEKIDFGEKEEEEHLQEPPPPMTKNKSGLSDSSQDSGVNMVFPHLNKTNKIKDDDANNPFSVTRPVKGSHVTYTVKGIDSHGRFEGSRRYNDFNHLRNALVIRWPGIYFPPIPPKKKVGNKELKFLEERRYFLERFLRKLGTMNFVLTSEEFQIFRQNGDIEKNLVSLPKLNADLILARFRDSFNLEESVTHEKQIDCKAKITDFQRFYSQILPILESIKEQVKELAPITDQHKKEYYSFLAMLEDYEERDLSVNTKLSSQKLIVNAKGNNIIKKIKK